MRQMGPTSSAADLEIYCASSTSCTLYYGNSYSGSVTYAVKILDAVPSPVQIMPIAVYTLALDINTGYLLKDSPLDFTCNLLLNCWKSNGCPGFYRGFRLKPPKL